MIIEKFDKREQDAWLNAAIAKVEADYQRSADTHLIDRKSVV